MHRVEYSPPPVQAPYWIPGASDEDAGSSAPRSPQSPRLRSGSQEGDADSSFMGGLGRAITKMARKSLLMHEVVVDPSSLEHMHEHDRSGPRDQMRFLKDEIMETKKAVQNLDAAVAKALSFREKSSRLLEEAHRALSRLEQAIDTRSVKDLIEMAVEVKVSARRGITLVDVYGGMGTLGKMATIVIRKQIHAKFDKVIDHLQSLLKTDLGPVISAPAMLAPAELHTGRSKSVIGVCKASTISNAGPTLSTQSQILPPVPSQGPYQGSEIRSKHEKVHCIAFVPQQPSQQSGRASSALIWWSAGARLESYGADEATTEFPIDRPQVMAVTALAIDTRENIWTGHIKGTVRVRRKDTWEFVTEERAFGAAVRVIFLDDDGQAWIGDETGMIRVWRLPGEDEEPSGYGASPGQQGQGALQLVATLQRSAASTFNRKHGSGRSRRNSSVEPSEESQAATAALANAIAAVAGSPDLATSSHPPSLSVSGSGAAPGAVSGQSPSQTQGQAPGQAAGPVQGHQQGWLHAKLFGGSEACHSGSTTTKKQRPVTSVDGPVRSMHVWGVHAWVSAGRSSECRISVWSTKLFQELDAWDCGQFGPCNAMKQMGWASNPSSIRRTNSPGMGGARFTTSPGQEFPQVPGEDTVGVLPLPNVSSSGAAQWRLLTGHENGQLLLWHPDSPRLAPLISIGDTGSPVRGIVVFEDYGLVVSGHHSGELVVFQRPGWGAGAGGADLTLAGLGGGVLGADSRHPNSFGMYRPKKYVMRAHKSALSILQGYGVTAATASALGTIRLWSARDIALEAERHGITAHTAMGYDRTASGAGLHSSQSSGEVSRTSAHQAAMQRPRCIGYGVDPHNPHSTSPSASGGDNRGDQYTLHNGTGSHHSGGGVTQPHTPAHSGRGHGPGHHRTSSAGALDVGAYGPHLLLGGAGMGMHHVASQPSGMQQVQHSMGSDTQGSRNIGGMYETLSNASAQDGNRHSTPLTKLPAGFMGTCQTIDYSELHLKHVIGTGAYGKVWLAEWTGCQVAVKELLGFAGSEDETCRAWQEMQNEVQLLGSLSHPNIMRFMAVSLDPPTIVMQYYAHGSLFALLQRARRGDPRALRELTWVKRLEMLRDVAAGMHYLHTRKPPVIHGDLRSPNLLLDLTIDDNRPRYHVKIADFGLARMMNQNSNMVMLSKTTNPRWTAPEVIRDSQIGTAGDVYSFGIIMWEMLTWQQPYEEMMSVQVIFSTVSENSRPDIPADAELPGCPGVTLTPYKALMEHCWSPEAMARPSFKQIVDRFQNLRELEVQDLAARQPRSTLLRKGPSASKLAIGSGLSPELMGTGLQVSTADTPSSSAGSTKSDALAAAMFTRLGSGGGSGVPAVPGTVGAPLLPLAESAAVLAQAHAQHLPQMLAGGRRGTADASLQPYGMSPISEENSMQENMTPSSSFRASSHQPAATFLNSVQPPAAAPAASASPFAAAAQAGSKAASWAAASPFLSASQQQQQQQPSPASASPFAAAQTAPPSQQRGAAAASPFAAAQATSSASSSPFAAAQATPSPSTSRFAAVHGTSATSTASSASPFASAQPLTASTSPFASAQGTPASTAASASPFAAAQPSGAATGAQHSNVHVAASTPVSSASPFAAAQPRTIASASPFASAQPYASTVSPFAQQQQQEVDVHDVAGGSHAAAAPRQPAASSPFAAAQPQPPQVVPVTASPFAAAYQQQLQQVASSSPRSEHPGVPAWQEHRHSNPASTSQAAVAAAAAATVGLPPGGYRAPSATGVSRCSSEADSLFEPGSRDSPVNSSPGMQALLQAQQAQGQAPQGYGHGSITAPHHPRHDFGHVPAVAHVLALAHRRGSVASSTWSDSSMDPAPSSSPPRPGGGYMGASGSGRSSTRSSAAGTAVHPAPVRTSSGRSNLAAAAAAAAPVSPAHGNRRGAGPAPHSPSSPSRHSSPHSPSPFSPPTSSGAQRTSAHRPASALGQSSLASGHRTNSNAAAAARITAHEAASYALGLASDKPGTSGRVARTAMTAGASPVKQRSSLTRHADSPARTASIESNVGAPGYNGSPDTALSVQSSSTSQPLIKLKLPIAGVAAGATSPRSSHNGGSLGGSPGMVRRTGSVTMMSDRSSIGRAAAAASAAVSGSPSPARSSRPQHQVGFGSSSASRMSHSTRSSEPRKGASPQQHAAAGSGGAVGLSRPQASVPSPPSSSQMAADADGEGRVKTSSAGQIADYLH